MSKPRVLLADDHTIVAEGLRSLLEDEFEFVGAVGVQTNAELAQYAIMIGLVSVSPPPGYLPQ